MSSNRVKLRFETVHALWQFAQRIGAAHMEINTSELTLTCSCSETDIGLASELFVAEKISLQTEGYENRLHHAALRAHLPADRNEQGISEGDKRAQASN